MDRRTFLLDTVLPLAGLPSVITSDNQPSLDKSRRTLIDLAFTIDDLDLADPSNSETALNEIEKSIKIVEEELENGLADSFKKPVSKSDRMRNSASTINTIRQDQLQLINQVDTIESVLPYYRSLERYLHVSENIHEAIRKVEKHILERDGADILENDRQLPGEMKEASKTIETIESLSADIQASGDQNLNKITPDLDAVSSEITLLYQVYEGYTSSLVNYSSSVQLLEEGAIVREEEVGNRDREFRRAEDIFKRAVNQTDIEFEPDATKYSIDESVFSLVEYQNLLSTLNKAAENMRKSCSGQNEERLEFLQQGRQLIIEARRIAESSV